MTYRYNAGGGGAASGFAGNFDTIIDPPPSTAATPDDEFPGAALDLKWTVVDGTAAPIVFPLGGVAVSNYEVGGGLLQVQTGGATAGDLVRFRQDYELPSGRSIVAKMLYGDSPGWGFAGVDYNIVGLTLNDDDTSHLLGNRVTLQNRMAPRNLDFESGALGFIDSEGLGGLNAQPAGSDYISGDHIMFRIMRGAGNRYVLSASRSGLAWTIMDDVVSPTPLNNIWLHHNWNGDSLVFPDMLPSSSWDWVREGSNGVIPEFGP